MQGRCECNCEVAWCGRPYLGSSIFSYTSGIISCTPLRAMSGSSSASSTWQCSAVRMMRMRMRMIQIESHSINEFIHSSIRSTISENISKSYKVCNIIPSHHLTPHLTSLSSSSTHNIYKTHTQQNNNKNNRQYYNYNTDMYDKYVMWQYV